MAPSESTSRGKQALLSTLLKSHRTLPGRVGDPELQDALGLERLRSDAPLSDRELCAVRKHLMKVGFSVCPEGHDLVRLLNSIPKEQLTYMGADFRSCVGLSDAALDLLQAATPVAAMVLKSVDRLRRALPPEAVILGALEGTHRGQLGAISWLHLDENRTSAPYLQQALFPLPPNQQRYQEALRSLDEQERCFGRYASVKAQLEKLCPGLQLPEAIDPSSTPGASVQQSGHAATNETEPDVDLPASNNNSNSNISSSSSSSDDCDPAAREGAEASSDLFNLTQRILEGMRRYHESLSPAELEEKELLLDFVNVWIPSGEKQMVLVPLENYSPFRSETRPSPEELRALALPEQFETFDKGLAVLFFGRYCLHQAGEGPDFTKCPKGSMETRYLVAMPRGVAHRQALYRPSCFSYTIPPSLPLVELEEEEEKVDPAWAQKVGKEGENDDDAASQASLGDEPHLRWYLSLWN